jgi:hypothetical protein
VPSETRGITGILQHDQPGARPSHSGLVVIVLIAHEHFGDVVGILEELLGIDHVVHRDTFAQLPCEGAERERLAGPRRAEPHEKLAVVAVAGGRHNGLKPGTRPRAVVMGHILPRTQLDGLLARGRVTSV